MALELTEISRIFPITLICKQFSNVQDSSILATHFDHLFNFQGAFDKDGPQLVSDPCQQEAEERDAKYGIKNAKDFPALCSWGNVSISCRSKKERRERRQ